MMRVDDTGAVAVKRSEAHMQMPDIHPARDLRTLLFAACLLSFAAPSFADAQGFRTEHILQDHYEKYGREFGAISQHKYLRLAQRLRDAHTGGHILESRRPDGFTRFDLKHGYFGDYDLDGTIRTFFIPPDGVRYFQLQAR